MSDSVDRGEFYVCTCDHCGQKLEFPKRGAGMEVACPGCGVITTLHGVRHLTLQPSVTSPTGQPVSEDKTEVMVKPGLRWGKWTILLFPVGIVMGLLSPYPRFYQFMGCVFAVMGAIGCVAEWSSPGRTGDSPSFGMYFFIGVVVSGCATLVRKETQGAEAKRKALEIAEYERLVRKLREKPFECPKCRSQEIATYQPSKPLVLTPMTFTGILMGGIANSMADRIFKEEKVCQKCGLRWPADF